jgi:hypothetical protein
MFIQTSTVDLLSAYEFRAKVGEEGARVVEARIRDKAFFPESQPPNIVLKINTSYLLLLQLAHRRAGTTHLDCL